MNLSNFLASALSGGWIGPDPAGLFSHFRAFRGKIFRSMSLFFQVLLFGVLAAAANVLGGLILFPSKLHSNYRNALRYVLALGAGFMLSVTLLEIFPETIHLWLAKGSNVEALYKPML